jgi:hypothetical protein
MTGLYVYGISPDPVHTRARGVFRRPLRSLQIGHLYVIVESAARPPAVTVSTLTAHSRVLAALVEAGVDVLPVRFGTFAPDAAQLRRVVDGRRAEVGRALRLVRGRVQMTVRVRRRGAEPSATGQVVSGSEYLRARATQDRTRSADPVLRAIRAAAKPYARAAEVDWRQAPAPMLVVHHLVARRRVPAYTKAIARAIARHGVDAVVSGPWAPFAFAEVT